MTSRLNTGKIPFEESAIILDDYSRIDPPGSEKERERGKRSLYTCCHTYRNTGRIYLYRDKRGCSGFRSVRAVSRA